MNDRITVGIPTKDRYDTLSYTLLSIAMQEMKPYEVIIVDDTVNPVDLRNIPTYEYIFRLFDQYEIKWKVLFGEHKGQHISHQTIQQEAECEFIFRIDDDEVAEPDVLKKLYLILKRDLVGAVGPSVVMANAKELPFYLKNSMATIKVSDNAQWFLGTGVSAAEHLYSSFMYRKGICEYETRLSPVAHREETIFTHSLTKKGYLLYINHDAKVWHFRSNEGGIRSHKNASLWEHDEIIFEEHLKNWDNKYKYIVLDNGLGDHYAFKNILSDIKKSKQNLIIACCYPEVFADDNDLCLISIAQAKKLFGNIDRFNIYKFMSDNHWDKSLVEAFKTLYL